MTKYREILRLTALGLSQRNIIQSIGVSQKTIVKVQRRAQEMHLSWPLDETLTDAALEKLMFPKESKASKQKRMPDFNYIQKELLRNGVNKKLLWTEYLEECRQSGDDPLMYSQFCYYIQQDEQKRRATMHINRKPGEQIEVDWAGDPVLFGKLNAASSVRLKQVFQSVIQWYEAHSFGHFRQAILCGKTIMQIILHDGF